MIVIGIITSIILFSIIVLVHEFGHFKASRIFGVKVEEFGLGIPPKVKTLFTDKSGTKYSLNWLPLGGFVRLKGEQVNTFLLYDKNNKLLNNENLEKKIRNNEEIFDNNKELINQNTKAEILKKLEDNFAKDSLLSKHPLKQAIIILAGVFMNFLLAGIIFSILFFVGVKPIGINTQIKTNLDIKILPNYETAIKEGILIKKHGVSFQITDKTVKELKDLKYGSIESIEVLGEKKVINDFNDLKNILDNNVGNKIKINGKTETNNFSKDLIIPEDKKLGVYIGDNIEVNSDFKYKYSFINSIKYGFLETYNQSLLTLESLKFLSKKIFNPNNSQERTEALKSVSGPIGIVSFISKTVGNGLTYIFVIGAIISINLGVFNLLPIPALDGGRFLIILINSVIQKIFGKKAINETLESMIHVTFFIFLIALSILIAYNDVNNLITK